MPAIGQITKGGPAALEEGGACSLQELGDSHQPVQSGGRERGQFLSETPNCFLCPQVTLAATPTLGLLPSHGIVDCGWWWLSVYLKPCDVFLILNPSGSWEPLCSS